VTTFSLILSLYFYSFSSFFSLYYFCPIRKEEKRLSIKLFDFGCPNITPIWLIRFVDLMQMKMKKIFIFLRFVVDEDQE